MTTHTTEVRHDAAARRFVADVEGHQGHVEYEQTGDTMAITHTIVPQAIGGRGVAAALVQAALDHARAQGWKVEPRCSYADAWMRRHAGYQDLRA